MNIWLVIISTLFFGFIAWRKRDISIALLIALAPAYQLRFTVWFIPMTFLEVMVLVVAVVWLFKTLVEKKWKEIRWPWWGLTLAFILSGVLAVLISPDTRAALGLFKAYVLEPVLFFYAFVNSMRSPRQWRMVIWALGASVLVTGFFALLQYLNLFPGVEPYISQVPKRATSLFPFPTAIGKYVGPILALFLGYVLAKVKVQGTQEAAMPADRSKNLKKLYEGVFFWGVIGFGFLGLVLSFSRGALIGVFASLVFISFFSMWKKWLWAGLGLIIVISLLLPFTRHEIISVFTVSDTSADVHVVMWKGAIRIIEAHPLAGTGLASFPIVYEKYKEASHTEFFPNPDELIFTLWIEMGLAGLVIFFWIVVKFFAAGISLLKTQNAYAVGLLAAMVALVVHGFFDTPYFKNDLAIIFWALAGLIVMVHSAEHPEIE